MKINKQIKHNILIVILLTIQLSCSTVRTGVQQVQLGMSKQEVLDKIKSSYELVSMIQTPQGSIEAVRFENWVAQGGEHTLKGHYVLHFLNDRLVELNYEEILLRPNKPHRGVRHE